AGAGRRRRAPAARGGAGGPRAAAAGTVSAVVALVLDAVDAALAAEGVDQDVLRAARAAGLDDVAGHARLARALQAGRADDTLARAREVIASCRAAERSGSAPASERRRVRETALAISAGVDQLDEPAALRALADLAPLDAPTRELAVELLDAARPLGDLSMLEPT